MSGSLSMLLLAVAAVAGQEPRPAIESQVVFLYYEDIDAATVFWGDTLGLELSFDAGWVRIFQTGGGSAVGLVDQVQGTHRAAQDKPVMVSLVVPDVDAWYRHLIERGVTVGEPPADSERVPVRAFMLRDPGGYTVEFFQWLEAAQDGP